MFFFKKKTPKKTSKKTLTKIAQARAPPVEKNFGTQFSLKKNAFLVPFPLLKNLGTSKNEEFVTGPICVDI